MIMENLRFFFGWLMIVKILNLCESLWNMSVHCHCNDFRACHDISSCLCRSALQSFKRRVAYANVQFDRILLFCVISLLLLYLDTSLFNKNYLESDIWISRYEIQIVSGSDF